MRQIIRTKRSGQVLGFLLFLIGLTVLLAVFWKAWLGIPSSSDTLNALWWNILNEQFDFASLFVLRLSYLGLMGSVFLVLGIVILALSRQIFHVSSGSISLKCPHCKNSWRAGRAMGWAECPFCRKFIQPQATKTIA